MSKALTYWWKKYQNIKTLLDDYMRENKISSAEEAINKLLEDIDKE